MSTYGINVSSPGVDVRTISNKDSQFKGAFTTLKILKWGEVAFQTSGASGSLSVRHGLGFAPAFYVFQKTTTHNTNMDITGNYANAYVPNPENPGQWNAYPAGGAIKCYTTSSDLIISGTGLLVNTVYTFKYYIFIDPAMNFNSQQLITLQKNYGFEVAKSGINIGKAQDYQKVYSNKYRSLQYYKESYQTGTITLPDMAGDVNADTSSFTSTEGTYIDLQHGLGYPPFFLVYFQDTGLNYIAPYLLTGPLGTNITMWGDAWCDSLRIRISLYREMIGNTTYPDSGGLKSVGTLSWRCFIFTEDLSS